MFRQYCTIFRKNVKIIAQAYLLTKVVFPVPPSPTNTSLKVGISCISAIFVKSFVGF